MYYQRTNLTETDIIRAFEEVGVEPSADISNQILDYVSWLETQRIRRVERARQLAAKIGNLLPPGSSSVALGCIIAGHYDQITRGKTRTRSY